MDAPKKEVPKLPFCPQLASWGIQGYAETILCINGSLQGRQEQEAAGYPPQPRPLPLLLPGEPSGFIIEPCVSRDLNPHWLFKVDNIFYCLVFTFLIVLSGYGSGQYAAGQHESPLSGLNKGFLFYSTDDDDDRESRTGAAGNSGLGTHPIPRVLLGKVRRLLTTHSSESFLTRTWEANTPSQMDHIIGKVAECAGEWRWRNVDV